MQADADEDIAFLFRKQLQEADLVCVTKSDLYPKLPPSLAYSTCGRSVRRAVRASPHGWTKCLQENCPLKKMCSTSITSVTRRQRQRWHG